jgi:hypothetical protein
MADSSAGSMAAQTDLKRADLRAECLDWKMVEWKDGYSVACWVVWSVQSSAATWAAWWAEKMAAMKADS